MYKLVDLDKSNFNFTLDTDSAQYNKAVNGAQKKDINKAAIAVKNAENNYNFYKDQYNKTLSLYEQGVVPKQQLDGINLQLDTSKDALNSAKQSLQQLQSGSRPEDKQALHLN